MDWSKKWLVDFNGGKAQLVSFDRSKSTGAIDVKMDGSVLEEKTSFKMLGLIFSSKSDCGSYIVSITKTASSMKFLSPEFALYLYRSTIRPCMKYCCHVWAGPLVATWNCWISYRNGYAGLLVLRLLLFLNPWIIVEI